MRPTCRGSGRWSTGCEGRLGRHRRGAARLRPLADLVRPKSVCQDRLPRVETQGRVAASVPWFNPGLEPSRRHTVPYSFDVRARPIMRNRVLGKLRQHVGRNPNPISPVTKAIRPKIADADVTVSVCPYCAVGCSQLVYTRDGRSSIEGNPAPDQRRHPLPQGSRHSRSRPESAPRHRSPLPSSVWNRLGTQTPSPGRWIGLPTSSRRRGTRRGKSERRRSFRVPHARHRPHGGAHPRQRRELPDQKLFTAGSVSSASRTQARI
jgi:formate dehydrogenase major subunit